MTHHSNLTKSCSVCLNLDFSRGSPAPSASLQVILTRLEQSSQTGCSFCTALRNAVKVNEPQLLGLLRTSSLRFIAHSTEWPLIVEPTGPASHGVYLLYTKSLEIYVQRGVCSYHLNFVLYLILQYRRRSGLACRRFWTPRLSIFFLR